MAVTENTYTGDGFTVLFSFTFPYIDRSDIKVSLNGMPTTAFTLANATTVQMNVAPANGSIIRIYRVTNSETVNTVFYPGSSLRSADLNNNFLQNLYIAQETSARTITGSTPTLLFDLDFNGNKGINHATPTNGTDICTKGYADSLAISGDPSFTQTGTGAVARTWDSKLTDSVSLLDFGAVGDGVVDDSSAVQLAIDSGAPIIDGLGKTYKVTQKITLRSNLLLQNCVFDMQQYESGNGSREFAFDAQGTLGSTMLLTANADADLGPSPVITLSAPDAATLAPGDLIQIRHNVFWGWDTSNYIGEIVGVKGVNGTQVSLHNPLLYSYTTSNSANVRKITPVENITISNVRVIGPVNPAGLTSNASGDVGSYYQGTYPTNRFAGFFGAYLSKNIRIQNLTAERFNRGAVEFRMSFNSWLVNSYIKDIPNYYGCLVADSSRNTWICYNSFENTRHGVATGASNTFGGGIVTHLYIDGNTSVGRDAALDCHPPADHVSFTNNKVYCDGLESQAIGVIYQGRNLICSGNTITGNVKLGILHQSLYTYPGLNPSTLITGNQIVIANDDSGTTTGIQAQYGINAGNTADSVVIQNNIISGPLTRGIAVTVEAAATSPLKSTQISNNNIQRTLGPGILVRSIGQNISDAIISNNYINPGGTNAYTGITLQADTGTNQSAINVVTNNIVNASSGVQLTGVGTFSNVNAKNNQFTNVTGRYTATFNEYTIASDAITLVGDNSERIRVDTEAAAATDDLTTINGGFDGQILVVQSLNSARDVTLKDGGGNLRLAGDFTLSHSDDAITLIRVGTLWFELSRSDNNV